MEDREDGRREDPHRTCHTQPPPTTEQNPRTGRHPRTQAPGSPVRTAPRCLNEGTTLRTPTPHWAGNDPHDLGPRREEEDIPTIWDEERDRKETEDRPTPAYYRHHPW